MGTVILKRCIKCLEQKHAQEDFYQKHSKCKVCTLLYIRDKGRNKQITCFICNREFIREIP